MLDNSKLKQIIREWSYWDKEPPPSIPRKILSGDIPLNPDIVLVIQGVRRCGKSTLLAQIMAHKKLPRPSCTFVNFEDPRLSADLNPDLVDQIVSLSKKISEHDVYYFFLDEIQNVKGWEKWLHRKVERPSNEIYVITGSNASLLSGELSTALTGRHITLELFPFDYHEFKSLKGETSFESYLDEGGFPRPLVFEKPQELLREYFTDIIEKDVRRHISVRSTLTLTQLIKAVFEATGSEVSQRSLAKIIDVTPDTVKSYLDAAIAAYLLLPCPYFTFSEKQSAARNKKYYPIDLGLRKAIITKTGKDKGKELETVVFHHLRKEYRHVYYWRGKGEIDFIVLKDNQIVPYQVSWNAPQQRHFQAYEEFKEVFPKALPPVIVTQENIEAFLKKK
ncbi:MAG: ATP-binding protein [Deltaproteobacteria bacterium]